MDENKNAIGTEGQKTNEAIKYLSHVVISPVRISSNGDCLPGHCHLHKQ